MAKSVEVSGRGLLEQQGDNMASNISKSNGGTSHVSFSGISDEQLLDTLIEIIEKNRKREFIQMTIEVDKKRIARMLVRPINRNVKNVTFTRHHTKQLQKDARATSAKQTDGGEQEGETVVGNQPTDVDDPDDITATEYDLWWTPLHLMAKANRVEMISAADESIEELLTKIGGTDNWPDVFDQTPLHVACIKGHVAVCRMLCRQAAAVTIGKVRNVAGTAPGTILNLINFPDKLGCTPLHYTTLLQTKSQAEELARILLTNGCDSNLPDIDGFTPLALCAHRGNLEMTSLLMAYGANPNVQSPEDGWTPLMLAAYKGHLKMTCGLLNPQQLPNMSENVPRNMAPTPANPALASKLGATALIIAAQCGHVALVAEMFAASKLVATTINMQDVTGRTALAAATFKGHGEVVSVLLEKKANPNVPDNEGVTPLMIAVHKGFRSIVEMLLQAGADITIKDENGCTALMVAALASNIDMTRALISATYNLAAITNAQQKDGSTALIHAAAKGNEKMIELLMTAQAALEPARIVDDWSALYHAIYNEKTKCVKALITKASSNAGPVSPGGLVSRVLAEVNKHANITKITPLILACLLGNSHIARILIENGANPNASDWTDFTPLMAAAQVGEEKLVQLLLSKGANPDMQEYAGYCPLMIAALSGFAKICELLLTHDASPDLQQMNGRTALMLAAEKGFVDVVKVIIRRSKCDLSVSDVFRKTALHYAIVGANEKVVTALCDCEAIDPNVQDRDGVTPLMWAASNPRELPPPEPEAPPTQAPGDPKKKAPVTMQKSIGPPPEIMHIIPLLRVKTISLDLRDSTGDSALIRAYRAQNWPCAEALLRAGAAASLLAPSDQYPPLIFAAINGYLQGIKLIKHLAPRTVNVIDTFGRSALFHAIVNDRDDAVNLLLAEPAPTDIKLTPSRSRCPTPAASTTPSGEKVWFFGMSPLHAAAKRGNQAVCAKLLEAGANINQLNAKRETSLMLACAGAYWDVVELFLENKASITIHDTSGQTVLHRLCYIGDEYEAARGFRLLVKHRGASILDTILDTPAQNTPLHWAVICDQPEVVNELVILGANREIRNRDDKTPGQTVIYAPTLFECLGDVIGPLWREMATYLRKTGSDGTVTPEPLFTEEELGDIELMFVKGDEGFYQKCAAALVERFYEKSDDNSTLDTEAIVTAWRRVTRNYGDLPPILANIIEHCKGRTLIFRSATIENLTKVRSKSSAGFYTPQPQSRPESVLEELAKINNQGINVNETNYY